MLDAYIYSGLRTPFARHGGALAGIRTDDLLAAVTREVIERAPFPAEAYEDVIAGCTNQAGEDARNVARHAGLLAGLPVEVPGQTVNRLCGSGLAAVVSAAHAVNAGEGALFVAGGVESMSRAPYVLGKAARPFARNQSLYDTSIGPRFPNPAIVEAFGTGTGSMPETGENVARELGISREAADRYALSSQTRYEAARRDGFFDGEIMPLEVPGVRKQPSVTITADEHPRPETTAEKLARLKPLFEDGVITAGNASGINDGAGALIVGNRAIGEQAGVEPRARIMATAVAGVAPRVMGLGPVYAGRKALERAGLTLEQMDVIEINEAFAAQVLGCLKLLELAGDDSRVNPNGGAVAVGHPLGASGSRLAVTAMNQLERIQGRYALVSLCIGVGQGIAVILETL